MKTQINGYDVIHVDKNTGNIICETQGCTEIIDNNKSESEIKAEIYKQEHEMNFQKKEGFVKMFTDVTYILALKLPAPEFRVAIGICKFVSYENCILQIGHGQEIRNMDLDDISEVMELNYKTCARIVASLIKKGVLAKVQSGQLGEYTTNTCYVVNPYIYVNGRNPAKVVVNEFFKNSGWKELMTFTDENPIR